MRLKEFSTVVKGSPMQRATRPGLQRFWLQALGNIGVLVAVQPLVATLGSCAA